MKLYKIITISSLLLLTCKAGCSPCNLVIKLLHPLVHCLVDCAIKGRGVSVNDQFRLLFYLGSSESLVLNCLQLIVK